MDPKRRRRESTTPLTVTFGEAFLHPANLPQTVPFVDAPPLVIEVEEEADDEPSKRALENLSRGRR